MEQNNKIRVYTSSQNGNLEISVSGTRHVIEATNNRAKYFSEQSLKYRDEAKKYAEDARFYAEQNSDVSLDDLLNLKSELQKKIDNKQDVGNYALKEELPINVSELLNDAKYTNETQLFEAVPNQDNNAGKVLYTNGENTSWIGINTFELFDTKLSDRVLNYEETKGWALQGTYVYKEAIAGSRYGYPDFYAKCLEEFNEATFTETINGITVKTHSNGHKFYNIADKTAIDNYFNTMGSAWFYGVDTENERIFLPRNNWFEQASITGVGQSIKAGLPNIEGATDLTDAVSIHFATQTGAFTTKTGSSRKAVNAGSTTVTEVLGFDASLSNPIYGNSNTVQPNSVKKLLYICVGNTTNYEGVTDVVNQGMEIIEQVALKVNVDGTNLNTEGKSLISGYAMPSDRYIDLTLGASGTEYTAPANGWFTALGQGNQTNTSVYLTNNVNGIVNGYTTGNGGQAFPCASIPTKKGDIIMLEYTNVSNWEYLRFIYAEGEV